MKKINLTAIGIIAVFTLLYSSCSTPPPASSDSGDMRFTVYTEKIEIPLLPETENGSPKLNCTFNLTGISSPPSKVKLFEKILYGAMNPEAYTARTAENYKTQYYEMGKEFSDRDLQNSPSFNWEYIEEVKPVHSFADITVMNRTVYTFTGGAHGSTSINYYVIDLNEERQLSLEELIPREQQAQLQLIVEAELRKQFNLEPMAPLTETDFFEETIPVPDDFFLSPQGLGLQWDQYEIAPYSVGSIEVVLPYEDIGPLLSGKGNAIVQRLR